MCYICEARGTVGKNYKAAQKAIAEAKRALPEGCYSFSRPDRTKPPVGKVWDAANLKAYAAR